MNRRAAIATLGLAAIAGGSALLLGDAREPVTIREQLADKAPHERANIKGVEIAKLPPVSRTRRKGFDIQMVELNPIEGGVEVFVKAWQNGKPVGFGDGTVEIERFRIYNPPVLVSDPNGVIVQELTDISGNIRQRKLREDPKEALLQVIEHNLTVMNIHGPEKIVKGKRGNTTSTFFPNAGAGAAPIDGTPFRSVTSEAFATINGSTGSGHVESTANSVAAYLRAHSTTADRYNFAARGIFGFDTSAIGSDTISSATFSLHGDGSGDNDNGLGNTTVELVGTTPSSESDLGNSDYDLSVFDTTLLATGVSTATYVAAKSEYHDWTLNASGLAYINTSGNTFFGTTLSWAINQSFTGTWVSSRDTGISVFYADQTGTTNDPKLVVEHTAGGGGEDPVVTATSSTPMRINGGSLRIKDGSFRNTQL